ncbi:hypothetical protein [Sphingopyxis sp. 113P3]|uniref:hypothetical protein n=1 Tax=Sphingopyxis sp. (strain 113P3) TaxID=292913 RepID=UPI0006AD4647|nr:hypothetical protein [Sphingopyxis sp. 113P3]ALC13805.1 hypothetical protein LH20_17750 [Sphingopyxis sp. 113P3]
MNTANRLYALDLLHRAGTSYDARDISVIASILPLVERDVIASIETPIGGGVSAAQAVCAARIGTGCHRPNSDNPASFADSEPGPLPPPSAPIHAGGGGPSGE